MNMHTKLSDKGQVVVPKAARDRLGWGPGTDLEVIETDDAVTLRRSRSVKTLTPQQAVAEFRRIHQHEGPPVSLDEMRRSAQEAVEEHWASSE